MTFEPRCEYVEEEPGTRKPKGKAFRAVRTASAKILGPQFERTIIKQIRSQRSMNWREAQETLSHQEYFKNCFRTETPSFIFVSLVICLVSSTEKVIDECRIERRKEMRGKRMNT